MKVAVAGGRVGRCLVETPADRSKKEEEEDDESALLLLLEVAWIVATATVLDQEN